MLLGKYFILVFLVLDFLVPVNVDLVLRQKLNKSTARKECRYGHFSCPYFPVFRLNTGKYGPEKTSYLDTFLAVTPLAGSIVILLIQRTFSCCLQFILHKNKISLTHCWTMFPFYIPWIHQKAISYFGVFRGYKIWILAKNRLIYFR